MGVERFSKITLPRGINTINLPYFTLVLPDDKSDSRNSGVSSSGVGSVMVAFPGHIILGFVYEPRHEISKTILGIHSLISAFTCRLNIL